MTNPPPQPLRILVADDERDTVSMLTLLLQDEGHGISGRYKRAPDKLACLAPLRKPD